LLTAITARRSLSKPPGKVGPHEEISWYDVYSAMNISTPLLEEGVYLSLPRSEK